MKKIIFSVLSFSVFILTACNNYDSKTNNTEHDMKTMNTDTTQQPVKEEKEIKTVTVAFTNVDTKVAASVKTIVDHYLHIKNALTNDNGSEAASGAKAMEKAISSLDKSLFTAEQKKVYDDMEDDLKEHAEHIGKNGDNIKHQRSHFAMLSEDVYDLVKNFGAGQPIYHDHCPMYNENKGAMWLSEMKEVKNPFYGSEMITCGSVEEVIK
jgi:Protein of unknown function (DUF3347)